MDVCVYVRRARLLGRNEDLHFYLRRSIYDYTRRGVYVCVQGIRHPSKQARQLLWGKGAKGADEEGKGRMNDRCVFMYRKRGYVAPLYVSQGKI